MSPQRTILARADVDVEFEREFAIYDLSKLLSILSLFADPDISFEDRVLVINQGKAEVRFRSAETETIVSAGPNELNVVSSLVEFSLEKDVLANIQKAISILGSPDLVIGGKNGLLSIRAKSHANSSADTFGLDLGGTDKEFVASIKTENLKLIPRDYEVSVVIAGKDKTAPVVHLNGGPIKYWIAVDADSSKIPQ